MREVCELDGDREKQKGLEEEIDQNINPNIEANWNETRVKYITMLTNNEAECVKGGASSVGHLVPSLGQVGRRPGRRRHLQE